MLTVEVTLTVQKQITYDPDKDEYDVIRDAMIEKLEDEGFTVNIENEEEL